MACLDATLLTGPENSLVEASGRGADDISPERLVLFARTVHTSSLAVISLTAR
jgi:hypothetical protein